MSKEKQLSSAVISLIHHNELHTKGWWEKTVQNLIIAVIGSNENNAMSKKQVVEIFKNEYLINIDNGKFDKQISALIDAKKIISLSSELIKLSEQTFGDYKQDLEKQKILEGEAEKKFKKIIQSNCSEINCDEVWEKFNSILLLPSIKELGIRILDFLKTDSQSLANSEHFKNFVSEYRNFEQFLKTALLEFFNLQDEVVRLYLIRQINAYFFLVASNLDEKTIKKVYEFSKIRTEIVIYLDTNFLFSVVDIHDNPQNEAAKYLMQVIKSISNSIKISLKVTTLTIDEFKHRIWKEREALKQARSLNFNVLKAGLEVQISSVRKKYYEVCVSKGRHIDPDTYFKPYYDDLKVTLNDLGISIDLAENYDLLFSQRQTEMYSEIETQIDYRLKQKLNYQQLTPDEIENEKDFLRNKLTHDVKLWYIIRYHFRNSYLESPKDVKHWILTIDNKFIQFDAYKQRNQVRVCIEPNEFSTMLQFFIPRSEQLEKAILGNFRLPFLYKDYDELEMTINEKILDAMSLYEDMTEEKAIQLLTNDTLRHKIKLDSTTEENVKLLESEFLKKNLELEEELKKKEQQEKKLQERVANLEHTTKEQKAKEKETEYLNNLKIKKQELENLRSAISLKEEAKKLQETALLENEHSIKDIQELIEEKVKSVGFWKRLTTSRDKIRSEIERDFHLRVKHLFDKKESLQKQISDIEKEISDLKKRLNKLENMGLDGEMQGALFERIVEVLLKRIYPNASIERSVKNKNSGEIDFVIRNDAQKEIIIIEAKGYQPILRPMIFLGRIDEQETVSWFLGRKFPEISKEYSKEKERGYSICACFITSAYFEENAIKDLEQKNKSKIKPQLIDVFYDRQKLEDLFEKYGLKNELRDLNKFFKKTL
ncbi:hypothetical protein [Thermoflexibacter ruber]|uniref:Restriction endonuclease n=1 Tax=Thermoflexibacter ruber TaxID=1003 RepID=A0A1I2JVI0_9BACT|nr:hypothetical protein [Thermoflexibacter ruber]SFF58574.1 hypothetical protein SAMN04488541_10694 [Thermoflexibacter ruber]